MTSLKLPIFIVNNFYYVINRLNINRVTIYRAKCLGIGTLKVLPTIFFRYNSEKIPHSENEAKQNRYEFPSAGSIIKCLEDFEKIPSFYKSFSPFFSKSLHIHFKPSQNVSPILLLNGLVMVTNEGSIACKCFKKKEMQESIRSNIAYFVHI